jgi:hypothetical protein
MPATPAASPNASPTPSPALSPSPTASTGQDALPELETLRAYCEQYLHGKVKKGSPRWQALVLAAGAEGKVRSYCQGLVGAASTTGADGTTTGAASTTGADGTTTGAAGTTTGAATEAAGADGATTDDN